MTHRQSTSSIYGHLLLPLHAMPFPSQTAAEIPKRSALTTVASVKTMSGRHMRKRTEEIVRDAPKRKCRATDIIQLLPVFEAAWTSWCPASSISIRSCRGMGMSCELVLQEEESFVSWINAVIECPRAKGDLLLSLRHREWLVDASNRAGKMVVGKRKTGSARWPITSVNKIGNERLNVRMLTKEKGNKLWNR